LSEARLSFTAGVSARIPGHVVHGFTAEIDEVTTEVQKEWRNSAFFREGKARTNVSLTAR
jgi:hypothetical protein